jgi:SET domain-containing protein
MIEVRESPGRGRGVFATRAIAPGAEICCDPVVEVPAEEIVAILRTTLGDYYWSWGDGAAIVFGRASMINDARGGEPNVLNRCLPVSRRMLIIATRDIAPGEEILLDYGRLES